MDRPDCACRQDLFLRRRKAEGPDYRQEGDLHHRNGRDLRRPDADGLVQFRGAVSAVCIWFSWRDGHDLPYHRRDCCAEPGEGPDRVSCAGSSDRADARADLPGRSRMRIASILARYGLGLIFTVFGLNGFLQFIHQPPPANPLAIQFLVSVSASHFAAFFFAMQVVGGLLLLAGYFVPLALTVLAAELYNILAFHLTLAPASIPPALVASVLWILVFLQYRESFKGIFSAKPRSRERRVGRECQTCALPIFPPGACPGQHGARAGRLRVVDSGLPAVPRKFQGHLQREA